MERESFTSLPIAKLLNDNFVSIKVDKEERGDVDRVYMTYVQVVLMGKTSPVRAQGLQDMAPLWHELHVSVLQ